MKTVLPEVSLSQLSGVSSTALESAMVAAINTLVNIVLLNVWTVMTHQEKVLDTHPILISCKQTLIAHCVLHFY